MVSIDNVYQKVLALSNKEQRGYMTPQEFNLLAHKAQFEIFDNYFHNTKTAYHKPESNMTFADDMDMLEEKKAVFKSETNGFTISAGSGVFSPYMQLPSDCYLLDSIRKYASGEVDYNPPTPQPFVQRMKRSDRSFVTGHPLLEATKYRETYEFNSPMVINGVLKDRLVKISPSTIKPRFYKIDYYREPVKPEWAYVVVKEKALYNSNLSTNFELHSSEEEALVSRILQLAGVIVMKPELIQIGVSEQASTKQEQND